MFGYNVQQSFLWHDIQREKSPFRNLLWVYKYKAIKWTGMLYKVIVFVIQQIAIYLLTKWLIFVFMVRLVSAKTKDTFTLAKMSNVTFSWNCRTLT